jgi:hypothetical protein
MGIPDWDENHSAMFETNCPQQSRRLRGHQKQQRCTLCRKKRKKDIEGPESSAGLQAATSFILRKKKEFPGD